MALFTTKSPLSSGSTKSKDWTTANMDLSGYKAMAMIA
jgi:hypothetical protein